MKLLEVRIHSLKQTISNRANHAERKEKSPGLKWFECYRCDSGLCCENCVALIFLGKPKKGREAPKCPVCRYETCNPVGRVPKHWAAIDALKAPIVLPPIVGDSDV